MVHIWCTSRRAVDQRSSPEGLVDGSSGPLLGRRHEVRVDTQREARVGVAQVLGEVRIVVTRGNVGRHYRRADTVDSRDGLPLRCWDERTGESANR